MKTEIDSALLIRYINDSCTADERSRVEDFLKDPQGQKALEDLLDAEYSSMDDEPQPNETTLEQWNQEFRDKYFKKTKLKIWQRQWFGYAAACMILLGIGGYFLHLSSLKSNQSLSTAVTMVEKTNPRGIRSKILLPDSSVVYLGAGSSILFPQQFATQERTLKLTGEAFFEVTKNPKRPFVIHTGEIQTTVLGTSFKITAFKGNPVAVEVATGKVRISRNENTKINTELAILTPGEGITWDAVAGKTTVSPVDVSAVKGWASGEISFKNRSLNQIAAELENWYDVEISFAKTAIVHKRLSLSVDGTAPLTDALDIICNTAHLNYHFNGKRQVVLSGHK